jgi:prevent-host-death family protein
MSMIRINIYEARTHLSEYLKRLRAGETIVLCKRNTPVAEIRPLPVRPGKKRPIGLAAGKVRVTKSFFEPLPEDVIASFRGGAG